MEYREHALPPKFKIRLFEFIVTFLVWWGLTWTVDPFSLLIGVVVSIITVFLLWDIFPPFLTLLFDPHRLVWILWYIPYFFYYVLKANIEVAYHILHPDLPIKPGIVKVRTKLTKDISKTFLANSITLTPGTLTVDIDGEYLYVHWSTVESQDIEEATKLLVEKFENIIWRIFE